MQCRSKCGSQNGWKGDFAVFAGNNDFCNCGFGGSCGFICGGGGDGSSGGQCPKEACSSRQYTFDNNVWNIKVDKSKMQGSPYRAFAYLKFDAVSSDYYLAFSFKTRHLESWGGYVKLLFWTDSGNILGLLPKGADAGNGKDLRLVAFMGDDYPNQKNISTQALKDDTWYSAKVHFKQKEVRVSVKGDNLQFNFEATKTDFSIDTSKMTNNGPQLGVYHFEFGQKNEFGSSKFELNLAALSGPGDTLDRHDCEHGCLVQADDGNSEPEAEPEQENTECAEWCNRCPADWPEKCTWSYCGNCGECGTSNSASGPNPTPPPAPLPTPAPPTGPDFCCGWGECNNCEAHNKQDSSTWCGASESQCSTCQGKWCPR